MWVLYNISLCATTYFCLFSIKQIKRGKTVVDSGISIGSIAQRNKRLLKWTEEMGISGGSRIERIVVNTYKESQKSGLNTLQFYANI